MCTACWPGRNAAPRCSARNDRGGGCTQTLLRPQRWRRTMDCRSERRQLVDCAGQRERDRRRERRGAGEPAPGRIRMPKGPMARRALGTRAGREASQRLLGSGSPGMERVPVRVPGRAGLDRGALGALRLHPLVGEADAGGRKSTRGERGRNGTSGRADGGFSARNAARKREILWPARPRADQARSSELDAEGESGERQIGKARRSGQLRGEGRVKCLGGRRGRF